MIPGEPTYQDIEFGPPEITWKKVRVWLPYLPLANGGRAIFGTQVMRGDFDDDRLVYLTVDDWTQLRLEGKI